MFFSINDGLKHYRTLWELNTYCSLLHIYSFLDLLNYTEVLYYTSAQRNNNLLITDIKIVNGLQYCVLNFNKLLKLSYYMNMKTINNIKVSFLCCSDKITNLKKTYKRRNNHFIGTSGCPQKYENWIGRFGDL